MFDAVGQQLGNYRLTRKLGSGGAASVYLGEHLYLGSQVAIKLLNIISSETDIHDFLTEAHTAHQMTHPHILRILDFGIQHDIPFLIMEYAKMGTLRTHHPRGTSVPLATVIDYVKQIASGLQFLHDHRLIHRDLKPANLLLGSDGQILLSDFGLAVPITSSINYLNTNSLIGSMVYTAPEYFNKKLSEASDQYALSVMVYEWLSGKPPFEGTPAQLCHHHLSVLPPALRETLPNLPELVERVVLTGLAKEPTQRFPDVRTFALALSLASSPQPSQELLSLFPSNPVELSGVAPPPKLDTPLSSLPRALTRLLGREEERQALGALLIHPDIHLVTLVGVGGIGKTRLALACAHDLQETFADGVYFISLVPITDSDRVLPTLAQALNLKENSGQRIDEILKAFLREKRLLLLLDNFEQVIDAAPELASLLSSCPDITVLVTSREALQIQGEQQFPIGPLDLPTSLEELDVERLSRTPAIMLFVERAQACKPDFRLTEANAHTVADICTQLEGLPLAIELAAARIRLLPPRALLSRLSHRLEILTGGGKDRPARQQTLRKTLEWSYELLTVSEQQLFSRLAIFVGGCSLSAIEGLFTALGEETADLLEGVSSLLNKSLLEQHPTKENGPRFSMLETLREFGLERLTEANALSRCQEAHTAYFQRYIKEVNISRSFYDAPIEQLAGEYSNIRAALQNLRIHQDLAKALRLCCALTGFWFLSGTLSDGSRFLEPLLQTCQTRVSDDEEMHKLLAIASNSAGWLAFWQYDGKRARARFETSLHLFKQLENPRACELTRLMLGLIDMDFPQGNYHRGEVSFEKSLSRLRQIGKPGDLAIPLLGLAIHKLWRKDLATARSLCLESQQQCRAIGSTWGLGAGLHYLGWICYLEGKMAEALELSQEGLVHLRKVGTPTFLGEALMVSALLHLKMGDQATAQSLLEEALLLGRRMENLEYLVHALYGLGRLALSQGNLHRAQISFEDAVRRMDDRWNHHRFLWIMASCLEELGQLALQQNRSAWAICLFAAADTKRKSLGVYISAGIEHPTYEQTLSSARSILGEADFAMLWEKGYHLSPLEALSAGEQLPIPPPISSSPHGKRRESLPPAALSLGLTRREIDVLGKLSQGMTNAQIAESLVLSVVTVNSYLRSLYSKLGVTSRTQAIRYAFDHELLEKEDN